MGIHVMLGNPAPMDRGLPLPHPSVTYVNTPDSWDGQEATVKATPDEVVVAITAPSIGGITGGLWETHTVRGAVPDWVWSDDDETERLLSEHYQCARGIPDDVEERYYTTTPPGVLP